MRSGKGAFSHGEQHNLAASICALPFLFFNPTVLTLKFQDTEICLCITLFRTINLNVEENMSSLRKTNVEVRSLFSFVATLQEESHSQKIYILLFISH